MDKEVILYYTVTDDEWNREFINEFSINPNVFSSEDLVFSTLIKLNDKTDVFIDNWINLGKIYSGKVKTYGYIDEMDKFHEGLGIPECYGKSYIFGNMVDI